MYPELTLLGSGVSSYFLILSLVFTFMVLAVVHYAKKLSLNPQTALDMYFFIMLGSFIGSRLFYILYQEPLFYFENPGQIFSFWNGGYVFFGGFIGGVLGATLYLKRKGENLETWFNFSAPLLSLGYALGRFACFFSGCCYGKKTESIFAVFMHGAYRHPTQLYAVFYELTLFTVLTVFYKKLKNMPIYAVWMIGHGVGRVIMEAFRADPRGSFILGLSVSTWISLGLILLGIVIILKKKRG